VYNATLSVRGRSGWFRALFRVLGCTGLVLWPGFTSAGTEVIGSRFWHGPERTRLVLELSDPVRYKVFRLRNPERIVIDLSDSELAEGVSLLAEGDGPVMGVRSGTPLPKTLRVVLDLRAPWLYRAFLLTPSGSYPHRLVVDLSLDPQDGVSLADPSNTREEDYLVVIDPGHGGEDPGAIGAEGSHEKDVALAIASRLKRIINWDSRMRAVLTRTDDYYVSLRKRVAFAMNASADVFLSIHADAANRRSARGASVFILSTDGASSEKGKWLAQRENASDLAGGVDIGEQDPILQRTLLDMGLDWKIRESRSLGIELLKSLGRVGPLHSANVERAGFAVLKSIDIPAALIETGFMTNPDEEQALKQVLVQERIAGAIFRALSAYCDADQRCPRRTAEPNVYVVAPGDSLPLIAARLGLTLSDLQVANPSGSASLQLGQRLKVPDP